MNYLGMYRGNQYISSSDGHEIDLVIFNNPSTFNEYLKDVL